MYKSGRNANTIGIIFFSRKNKEVHEGNKCMRSVFQCVGWVAQYADGPELRVPVMSAQGREERCPVERT